MKKILLSIVLLFCVSVFAQNSNSEVEKLAKKMFVDTNNRDYDAILDMTHPKVYDIVPKAQMKTILKSTFEGNEQFSIDLPKTIPAYKVSKIYKESKDNLEYAFVSYDMTMKMTFHNQKFDDAMKKMMKATMKSKGMEAKFLSDNIIELDMQDRITILMRDNATNNKWVMINYDADSPIFYDILPSSLLEAAKEHKQQLMLDRKKKEE